MTEEFKEKLINLVRERPCLYDKKNKDYKNKPVKDNAWQAISEALSESVKVCQSNWTSVRQQYLQFLRKLKQPTGSGAGYRPTCRYEQSMAFCGDLVPDGNESYTNVDVIDDQFSNSESILSPSFDITGNVPQDMIVHHSARPPATAPPDATGARSHQKYGKRAFEDQMIKLLDGNAKMDQYDTFFSSMAAKVRKLSDKDPLLASEIQLTIHQLVFDTECSIQNGT